MPTGQVILIIGLLPLAYVMTVLLLCKAIHHFWQHPL